MGGKYTEAQKKASIKYITEKTDDIRIRCKAGTKERWQQMAQAGGRSLTEFVCACVEAVGADLLPAPIKAKVYKLDGEKTELHDD